MMVQVSIKYVADKRLEADWAEKKETDEDWTAYWTEKNSLTIDGKPTGIKM